MNEKEIAKEILLKMIETGSIIRSEFPDAKTSVDLVCSVYQQILKTVLEG
jgi:hypothetical protein